MFRSLDSHYLLLTLMSCILFQVYAAAAAQAAAGARISGVGGGTWTGGAGLLGAGGGIRPGFVFLPGAHPQFVNINAFTGAPSAQPGWGQPFHRRGFM